MEQIQILTTDSILQKNVKLRMNVLGWSIRRLAKEAGLAQSTMSDFFKEGHEASQHTVWRISQAFDIPVSQLHEPQGRRTELSEEENEIVLLWGTLDREVRNHIKAIMYSCR